MAPRSLVSQKRTKAFKSCTIAATGEIFGQRYNHDDIKRWVEYHGGTFTTVVDGNTTHLIATKEHWKKRLPKVRKAIHTKGRTKIVDFDWLEATIREQVRQRESDYSWKKAEKMKKNDIRERARKQEETRKQEHKEVTEQFNKGCEAALVEINSDNHHIYQDSTGFDYDITLARLDLENNKNERYQLKLYESHTMPHTYATFARFCRPHRKPITQLLAPRGSEFHAAFDKFQNFFRKKCQKHWSQRIEKPKAVKHDNVNEAADEKEDPEEVEARRIYGKLAGNPETKAADVKTFKQKEAQTLLVTEQPFVYVQPKQGKPVGVFPAGAGPDATHTS